MGEYGIPERRPRLDRPRPELAVGEARAREVSVGIDPHEGAAAPEMPECAR